MAKNVCRSARQTVMELKENGLELPQLKAARNILSHIPKLKVNKRVEKRELLNHMLIASGDDGTLAHGFNGSRTNKVLKPLSLVEMEGKYILSSDKGTYSFRPGSSTSERVNGKYIVVPAMQLTKYDPDMQNNTKVDNMLVKEANRLLKNSNTIVADGTAYMSKEAYDTDMKVAQTRQMAVKLEDERASKLNDKTAWKKYTDSVPKGIYGHDRYSGALGNVIEKLVGPKIVTDVAGQMLSRVHEDNIVVGDYNLDTHTLQIAKEPTKEEIDNASETALVQLYINKNPNNVNMDKLVEFVGANKAKAIERILDTVEKVRGSHVLTHELIHAGSSRFMRQNPNHPAVKRVEELYNEAMSKKDDIQSLVNHGDIITTRWQANKDEFVAEALSNPGLMNALSQIETTSKDKLSNMLRDLVDSLLDMLGLSKKVKNNLLEFTMDSFAAIIEAQSDKSTLMTDKVRDLVKNYRDTKGSDPEIGIGDVDSDMFIGQEETNLGDVLTEYFEAYYSADVAEGREIKTQEFVDLQNYVVSTYQQTMKNLDTGNVKLRMFENMVNQTAAQVDLRTKEMHIRWNKMSRLSRVSEVFLHEVNHLMSSHVFKENKKLRKLMEDLRDGAIESGVTYELFLDGIQNPTNEEIEIAKMKFEYTFDKTANVEEFYAYATTNEQVYNAIKDVKLNTPLIKELKMDPNKREPIKKVLGVLIKEINKMWRVLTGRNVRGGKMIVDMIQTIARLDVEAAQAKAQKESAPEGISDYAKTKIAGLDDVLEPVIQRVDEWSDKFLPKNSAKWLANHIKKIPVLNDLMETGIGQYLWRMVTQDTTGNDAADMYMVFRQAKQVIEKHTGKIRDGVKSVAGELYKDVDEDTKKAVSRIVLEGDLAQFSADEIKVYLEDEKELNKAINELERKVLTTDDPLVSVNSKKEQIDGLVEYLLTGVTKVHNQQTNANNIAANMMGELAGKPSKEMVKMIDELVSLKVLKNSDPIQKEQLKKLVNDENGLETLDKTINMYRGYMDNMRENAVIGINDPIPKGYLRSEEGLLRYELIPEEELEAQIKVNMKQVETEPYVTVEGKNYYLMTGRTKSVGFSEGAIGLISHTTEGIPVSALIRKNNELKGTLGLFDGELKRKTKNIINAINRQDEDVLKKFRLVAGQTMVPVYNHKNEVVDYRIQLNKLEKELHLPDRKTDLVDTMSHTFSRSIKTSLTASENKRVIDTIIENSAKGIVENPDEYVLVEEYTEEDRMNGVKREKRHDRWEYLPDHTKDYVYKKLEHKGIQIHKDYVELMTGEKDITIGNFAKFGIELRKYPVARAVLMALEAHIAEILGYVKNAMVVLNADILLGNQTSNAIVAATHGIDPIRYTKKFKKRWEDLNDYNKKSQQLAELEVRKMAGENVDNKIKQVKKQLEGNAWDVLVKDGQYTTLVEDINIEGQGEGELLTRVNEYLERKNLKGLINNIKNVLYINRTSSLYNAMLKTVHYGDAITRQIIKEELEEKAIKKEGKITKKTEREILNYLDQLLVNYGYTMNRWWKYAERVGGLFFMKYYLSQAKALMSIAKRNPAMMALTHGGQVLTGIDFQDPLDTYLRTGIDGVSYRWMMDDAPSEILRPNIFDLIPDLGSIVRFN